MPTRAACKYWAEIVPLLVQEGPAILSGQDVLKLPAYDAAGALVGYLRVAEGTVADFGATSIRQVGDSYIAGDLDGRRLEPYKRGDYYCYPES